MISDRKRFRPSQCRAIVVSVSPSVPECSPTLIWLTITVSNVAPKREGGAEGLAVFQLAANHVEHVAMLFQAFSSASVLRALGSETPLCGERGQVPQDEHQVAAFELGLTLRPAARHF